MKPEITMERTVPLLMQRKRAAEFLGMQRPAILAARAAR